MDGESESWCHNSKARLSLHKVGNAIEHIKRSLTFEITYPLIITSPWQLLWHIHLQPGFQDVACRLVSFSMPGYFLHGVSTWIFTTSFHFRALFIRCSFPLLRFRSPLRCFWWWSSLLEQSNRSRVGIHNYRGAYQLETSIHGEIKYISLV